MGKVNEFAAFLSYLQSEKRSWQKGLFQVYQVHLDVSFSWSFSSLDFLRIVVSVVSLFVKKTKCNGVIIIFNINTFADPSSLQGYLKVNTPMQYENL